MPAYPGWNLDLRWHDQVENRDVTYPMGVHYNCFGAKSPMLLVREVAMMLVMDRLTDKPDWHIKVFHDEIAEKWKTEALAWPNEDLWKRIANVEINSRWCPDMPKSILNRECVDYVILELRHKAEYFGRTNITPTLDATHSIAKSDVLVAPELHSALREAFSTLQADQAARPDWHPNTNETVQDLVHPSMYPLVYGRSRFLSQEVVGVADAIDKFAGKGEVIAKRPEWEEGLTMRHGRLQWGNEDDALIGGSHLHKSFWSTTYQWLPANVKFTADGGVQFASYINNLHPTKYRGIYNTIEKLVETALPMWDQCLAQHDNWKLVGPGRRMPRLSAGDDPDDGNPDNWNPKSTAEMLAREVAEDFPKDEADEGSDTSDEELDTSDEESDTSYEGSKAEKRKAEKRWRKTRKPAHPPVPEFATGKVSYAINKAKTLREQFKDTGLQIVVKMASIELTPEKPEFSPGGWHVEGQMNEHIVGTALYYLDSENITDSHLEFRTLTSYYQEDDYQVGQQSFSWMESVFGANLGSGSGSACLQNYGSVATPQGRLLAFPNVFHHRVSGFKLADPTKPGHRRFIALWLVDPFTRIISTANVPPQQAEWWADSAFGALASGKKDDSAAGVPPEITQLVLERALGGDQLADALMKAGAESWERKLPAELLNMVRDELGEGLPMTREEAEEHRLDLMKERSAFQDVAREKWKFAEYNFCEH